MKALKLDLSNNTEFASLFAKFTHQQAGIWRTRVLPPLASIADKAVSTLADHLV
jgi:hypothetical protein